MTVSPCSCMIMRNTPWVLGCCGPRFRVSVFSSSTTPRGPICSKIVSPSSGLWVGVRSGMSVSVMSCVSASRSIRLVDELLDGDVVVVGLVVPTHREADEVVGQQDLSQVGVPHEADAHHLKGLALHELGAGPDAGHGGHLGHPLARKLAAQDRAERLRMVVVGVEVVDQLEAVLPIDLG